MKASQIDPKKIAQWIAIVVAAIEAGKGILGRTYGKVHKAYPAKMNGASGHLVWDYIVWNEITFLPSDKNAEIVRLFNSVSDDATEAEFQRLVTQFGNA